MTWLYNRLTYRQAKADRGELAGGSGTIEQLQKETAKLANEGKLDDLEKLKKH